MAQDSFSPGRPTDSMPTRSLTARPLLRGAPVAVAVAILSVIVAPGLSTAQTLVRESTPERPTPDASHSEASTDADRGPSSEDDGDRAARSDDAATSGESGYDESFMDDTHRRKLYREGQLHYRTAALRTALFPALGNFYAEQYFIGGLNASLMGFAAVLIPYGLITEQLGFTWAGVGTVGAAYASGFITSAIGVRKYNRYLRRRLRLTDDPSATDASTDAAPPFDIPEARTFTITISF